MLDLYPTLREKSPRRSLSRLTLIGVVEGETRNSCATEPLLSLQLRDSSTSSPEDEYTRRNFLRLTSSIVAVGVKVKRKKSSQCITSPEDELPRGKSLGFFDCGGKRHEEKQLCHRTFVVIGAIYFGKDLAI